MNMDANIRDAWKFGSARCEGCGEKVDLSDCETVSEAKRAWNNHIQIDCETE
jgi:hypothetical protein